MRAAVEAFRPDIVLHGGAFTAVDACESDPDTAFAVNALGTRQHRRGGGRRRRPPGVRLHRLRLRRDARPGPTSNGTHPRRVGLRAEQARRRDEVRAIGGASATVVRTAWVSGAHGANMVKTVLRLAAADPDGPLRFVDDQRGCPTFTADLARAVVRLALDRRPGTFHVTNQGETTWFGFARATLAAAGLDPAGSSPSPPPTSTRPGRPRGRRTRGSTTPPCACRASRCSRNGPTPWTGWSAFPVPRRLKAPLSPAAAGSRAASPTSRQVGQPAPAATARGTSGRARMGPTGRARRSWTMGPPMHEATDGKCQC